MVIVIMVRRTVRGSNSTDGFDLDTQSLIGIYAGLVGSVWIFSIGRVVLFYFLLLKASRHLHNNMFIAVIRSPILFFDTNPVGMFELIDITLTTLR